MMMKYARKCGKREVRGRESFNTRMQSLCISRVAHDAANDRAVRWFIFHKGQNPSTGRLRRTSRVE